MLARDTHWGCPHNNLGATGEGFVEQLERPVTSLAEVPDINPVLKWKFNLSTEFAIEPSLWGCGDEVETNSRAQNIL